MSILTPLSNDPESLTEFAQSIGLDPTTFQFAEVFSLEDEVLEFVPKPCYSIIFLFPVGSSSGQLETRHMEDPPLTITSPWFTNQTLSNACGTIAVIHSIMNNLDHLKVKPDSWLSKFISVSASMTPEERAKYIEGNEEIQDLQQNNAEDDDTPILNDGLVDTHFICFTIFDGKLWELDGRKPHPICHGESTDILHQTINIIKAEFLPNIDDPMQISLAAFCAP